MPVCDVVESELFLRRGRGSDSPCAVFVVPLAHSARSRRKISHCVLSECRDCHNQGERRSLGWLLLPVARPRNCVF